MNYFEFTLVKEVKVRGKPLLTIFYILFNVIYWLSIFILVCSHSGHISIIENYKSTSILKIRESVFTNFSEDKFRPYLNKSDTFLEQYNRFWDSEDYSLSLRDEIQVITNLVITPNQTRSKCPESPYLIGSLCDPDNNHCEKGRHTLNGISTGRCVPCDIKYNENDLNPNNQTEVWTDRYCCEIEEGWCPAKYYLSPLKNHTAVLKDSKHSTLWLQNIVTFNEYDITLNNQLDPNLDTNLNLRYDPQTNAKCPIFKLETILECSKNNRQDYDTMAYFGALINIKISYKCFFPFLHQIFNLSFVPNLPFLNVRTFNQTLDCDWAYNFYRIDDPEHPPTTGYPRFRKVFLYDHDNYRTHWQSYMFRNIVEVEAGIGYYDPFKFFALFFAYHGLYSLLKSIISMYVRRKLITHEERHKVEEIIVFTADDPDAPKLAVIANESEPEDINEVTPLMTKSSINSI